jgi:hypothetical protein
LAKDFAGSDPVVVAFPDDLFGGVCHQPPGRGDPAPLDEADHRTGRPCA